VFIEPLNLIRVPHTPHTLTDFKPGIVRITTVASLSLDHSLVEDQDEGYVEETSAGMSLD